MCIRDSRPNCTCGCELKAVEVIVHRKKYSFDEPRLPWRVPYEPWLEGDDRSESVPTTYPATARLTQEPRGDGVAASIRAARGKGEIVLVSICTVSYTHLDVYKRQSLIYMQGLLASQDFWLLDLASMKSRPLTRLQNRAAMRTFDVTSDGKQIVFDRLRENSQVVMIDLPKE